MQYLLDTHTFLWFINGDDKLSGKARKLIEAPGSDCYVSITTFWEMAIKINLGKLQLSMSFGDLYGELDRNGFDLLPVTFAHTENVLLLADHHGDPFDRMLISQAIVDKLVIITADSSFNKYDVAVAW